MVFNIIESLAAFKGFCLVVLDHPQAMEKDLARLFSAIARYKLVDSFKTPLTADLQQIFQHTLDLYKSLTDLNAFLATNVSPTDVNNLRTNYNL